MTLVAVGSKSRIASLLIVQQSLERHLLRQMVHLVRHVGRGPSDGLLKRFHRLGWQLYFAVARFAML